MVRGEPVHVAIFSPRVDASGERASGGNCRRSRTGQPDPVSRAFVKRPVCAGGGDEERRGPGQAGRAMSPSTSTPWAAASALVDDGPGSFDHEPYASVRTRRHQSEAPHPALVAVYTKPDVVAAFRYPSVCPMPPIIGQVPLGTPRSQASRGLDADIWPHKTDIR